MMSQPQGAVRSSGADAVELAAACGVYLDPWQELCLDQALLERLDGSWAAAVVGLIASRQNGKNEAVVAFELYCLTVLNLWIIHTAHLFPTARESYMRLLEVIEAHPDTKDALVYNVASPASGYEMRFRGGGRIRFIARSRSSGRGLTGDVLICDEAQDLNDDAQGALLPTISARPGAQTWYLGSAPDETSSVFHRIRKNGRDGSDPRLAYLEFSADPDADLDDHAAWAQANPAYGDRVTQEAIASERGSMSPEMFARERLSISPDLSDGFRLIPAEKWAAVCDPDVTTEAAMFAVDANPERSAAAIVAVGAGPTVEVVDYRPGVTWVVDRCVELKDKYHGAFAVDVTGPAGAFVDELKRRRVRVVELSAQDIPRACESFYDRVMDATVSVRRNQNLDAAVRDVVKRNVGDGAWAFGRRVTELQDISPLVAASVGVWAWSSKAKPKVVSMADAFAQLDAEEQ